MVYSECLFLYAAQGSRSSSVYFSSVDRYNLQFFPWGTKKQYSVKAVIKMTEPFWYKAKP